MNHLTVTQASRMLSKGNDTIRRWFDTGILDGYRTPFGERMISTESVNRILARGAKAGE